MKKILFFLLLVAGLLSVSCDNFMNGSKVQDQLEQMIDVANAKSCTIVVDNDTAKGSFLSTGDKTCKLGYSIDVQYTVKKDQYIFKGLKAVNQFHQEISMNEYVEFTTIDSDNQRGVYKVSIKLVKESNDILIVPDCTPVPAVDKDKCTPEFKEQGVEQDTTVTFGFNVPITITEYFTPTITDAAGVSLADYFDVPYLSDDKQTMYIPTNKNTKLIDPNGDIETKDIIVKIDLTDIVDEEGNKGIGVFQHKYRVNKTRDTIKPVFTTAQLYSSSGNTLSDKAFANWSGEGANNGDFGTNHTNGAVHVEIDGYDNESGVGGIIVEEKLIKYTDGSTATSTAITTTLKCYKNEDTGLLAADYKINDLSDGVFELKFSLKDNADNVSEKSQTFYIIKDTIVDSARVKFAQEISQLGTSTEEWLKAVPVVTGDTQEVVLTLSPSTKDVFYGNYATDFEINAYWGYSENSIVEPITRTDNKFTFTRDVTKMAFIKLICKDAIGNEREVIKRMAPRIDMFEVADREDCYSIVNLRLYLMQCNINSGIIHLPDYAAYIYQLCYNPEESNDYIEVIPTIIGDGGSEFSLQGGVNTLNSTLTPPLAAGATGKLYMAATVGDFLSPRSTNFVQFEIYDAAEDGSWTALGDYSLTTGSDEAEYETIKALGPEGKPYIKDGFKVTTEGIKNSGTQKIVISDYMTQAGKDAGIEYSFYVVGFAINEHGSVMDTYDSSDNSYQSHEAPVFEFDTGNAVNSKIPEMYLNSSQSYMIYITAYDKKNKKKYVPFEFKTEYLHDEGDGDGNYKIDIPFSTEEGGHLPEGCSFYVNSGTTITTGLNLTGDYAAPYLSHDNNPFSNPVYFEIGVPTDNATGNYAQDYNYNPDAEPAPITLYKNTEGKYVLSYYIIPNVSNNIRLTPTYTINELRTLYKSYEKTIEYEPEQGPVIDMGDPLFGNKIQIPYGNLREGLYTISFIVEDIYGNAAVYTYPFINSTLGYCLPYTKEYKVAEAVDDTGVTQHDYYWEFTLNNSECDYIKLLTISGEQVPTITADIKMAEYTSFESESETPEWRWSRWGDDLCSEYNYSYDEHGWDFGDQIRHPNLKTMVQAAYPNEASINRWGKITGYYGCVDSDSTIGKGYFYTEYVFLAEDDVCNVKNCMEGINGMQVFFDNNVMIHTMYSPDQLTASKYDKDAHYIWETKGLETGLDIYPTSRIPVYDSNDPASNPNSVYYDPNYQPVATIDESAFQTRTYGIDKYKEIPSGYWYTTIIHFADGTVVMTDIKQKQ